MSENTTPHRDKHESINYLSSSKPLVIFLGLAVLCGLSFYGGVSFEKNKKVTTATNTNQTTMRSGQFGQGGRFGGQRPVRGQVTAVSSSSITVADSFSGKNSTYTITNATAITNNGQAASAGDIKTGDTVAVISDTSNTTQATQILINPTFGRGGAGGAPDGTAPTQMQTQ
jgi:hypothetical protein